MSGGIAAVAALATIRPALESWTMSPAAMRDWCANAAAGDSYTYARGWLLPRHSAAAAHARKLEAGRFVRLHHVRRADGMTDYVMFRLKVQRASIGTPPRPVRPVLDGDMARVLRVLRDCARRDLPCPFNREIERRAGVKNASYAIQKLVDGGIVTSEIVDPASGARVVTIAGGAKTAWPAVLS